MEWLPFPVAKSKEITLPNRRLVLDAVLLKLYKTTIQCVSVQMVRNQWRKNDTDLHIFCDLTISYFSEPGLSSGRRITTCRVTETWYTERFKDLQTPAYSNCNISMDLAATADMCVIWQWHFCVASHYTVSFHLTEVICGQAEQRSTAQNIEEHYTGPEGHQPL